MAVSSKIVRVGEILAFHRASHMASSVLSLHLNWLYLWYPRFKYSYNLDGKVNFDKCYLARSKGSTNIQRFILVSSRANDHGMCLPMVQWSRPPVLCIVTVLCCKKFSDKLRSGKG